MSIVVKLLMSLLLAHATPEGVPESKPTSFVPFFQNLQSLKPEKSQSYLAKLGKAFKESQEPELLSILQTSFPNQKGLPTGPFNEPVFQRISWNTFALKVTLYCNKKPSKTCLKIFEIHNETLQGQNP